jgi:uncharacterized membrane protein YvbJ
MAFCTKCGAQNADNAQFCESCGGKLESQQPINAQQTVVNEQPIVNQQQNQIVIRLVVEYILTKQLLHPSRLFFYFL